MNLAFENGRHKNAWIFSICIILDVDNFDVCDCAASTLRKQYTGPYAAVHIPYACVYFTFVCNLNEDIFYHFNYKTATENGAPKYMRFNSQCTTGFYSIAFYLHCVLGIDFFVHGFLCRYLDHIVHAHSIIHILYVETHRLFTISCFFQFNNHVWDAKIGNQCGFVLLSSEQISMYEKHNFQLINKL